MTNHDYLVDHDDGRTIVFVCPEPGCGRRVALRRGHGRTVVIDTGDFFATHHGAVGPVRLGIDVES